MDSMSIDGLFDESFNTIQRGVLAQEIEEGRQLDMRVDKLCADFRGFEDPKYDVSEWIELLSALKDFEKSVCSFEFYVFFYGHIARAALNTQRMQEAVQYAKAYLEINKLNNDCEGISAAYRLLCDIALANDQYSKAIEYYRLCNPAATENTDPTLSFLLKHCASKPSSTKDIFKSTKRPNSLKFYRTEEGKEEALIRFIMKAMHAGRNEAKSYIASAKIREK